MNTEVYVYCSKCKAIVDGIGSGDSRDMIICNVCNAYLTANAVGSFKPYSDVDLPEKRLYIPE